VKLKDPATTSAILRRDRDEGRATTRPPRIEPDQEAQDGEADDTESTAKRPSERLTEEQKRELERRARDFVIAKLKELGYEVIARPYHHPGHDLVATKGDQVLRIEVKGHLGRASVVDLSIREFQEYAAHASGTTREKWQLWNCEHVAADSPYPVTLTRYGLIPDDALDVRALRVDLRRCVPITDHLGEGY
jgi:hypothetical protein